MSKRESDWHEDGSAVAALATATRAAEVGNRHSLVTVVASYSAAQIGLLQIKRGATVEKEIYVHNYLVLDLSSPLRGASGGAVSAELAAGAAGVTGKVSISGYTS